jgi:pre-mRNA-processing factor 6
VGKAAVLRKRLESASDSVTGQTSVDPKGYLTSLNSMKTSTAAEIDDKKKAELLMDNITATNPKHAPGWIARARLEARAGLFLYTLSLTLILIISLLHFSQTKRK